MDAGSPGQDDTAPAPNRTIPLRLPSGRLVRISYVTVALGALVALVWWRHGSLTAIGTAFRDVEW